MKYTLLFVSLISAAGFCQGPVDGFVKGKGNLDLALSAAYQHSERFYAGTTLIDYERNLTSISLFGEYGLTANTDVIANVPFINEKFQDASVFVKHRMTVDAWKSFFSLLPAVGATFPMSAYATETSQSIGQRAVQIQPKLVVQFTIRHSLFFQVQGGYNYTFKPVPSSIPVSAKMGLSKGRWYLDVWYDYQKGLGDKEWLTDPVASFRELYVSYSKIGGVIYYGKPWEPVRAGVRHRPAFGYFINGSYVLSGVNLGKAFTVGAGVVCKMDLVRGPIDFQPGF